MRIVCAAFAFATAFVMLTSAAQAAPCPNAIVGKAGAKGSFDWSVQYDIKAGTFSVQRTGGAIATGKLAAICEGDSIVLRETESTDKNDGICWLTKLGAEVSGLCFRATNAEGVPSMKATVY
jgi:hypothetical protein